MRNNTFSFKQFSIQQDRCAMKVTTDGCLFGAWVADYLRVHPVAGRALDIGGGTGLLSMMVSQKTSLFFDMVEIDPLAAGQAFQNVLASPFAERIKTIQADITEAKNVLADQYEVIFSNPPFYENDLVSPDNRKSQAHHDHSLRLQSLLSVIQQFLAPGGHFFILLPQRRWEEIKKLAPEYGLFLSTVMQVKQSPKHDVFRIMIRGRHLGSDIDVLHEEEMKIRMADGNYSEEFVFLLKDYYLYLGV